MPHRWHVCFCPFVSLFTRKLLRFNFVIHFTRKHMVSCFRPFASTFYINIIPLLIDLWPWKTYTAMPAHVMNVYGKFQSSLFTKYRSIASRAQQRTAGQTIRKHNTFRRLFLWWPTLFLRLPSPRVERCTHVRSIWNCLDHCLNISWSILDHHVVLD